METPSSTRQSANAGPADPGEQIYHITSAEAWQNAQAAGVYTAESLSVEGFIHCSRLHQVAGSANRYFQAQKGLVVLKIDPGKLESRLVYEGSEGQDLFPHIYGPLNLDAVVRVYPLGQGVDGRFTFPGI